MRKEIGRNDPCPCGSGKKYKKCCGKPGMSARNISVVKSDMNSLQGRIVGEQSQANSLAGRVAKTLNTSSQEKD